MKGLIDYYENNSLSTRLEDNEAPSPSTHSFRVPPLMSYEEVSTIRLAVFTASVGLYQNVKLPALWHETDEDHGKVAFVVNAASTAVGSFATKLAKMNPRISPIIVTAGLSAEYARTLQPDVVVDFRAPNIVDKVRGAFGGAHYTYVDDASNLSDGSGSEYICTRVISATSVLRIDGRIETLSNGIEHTMKLPSMTRLRLVHVRSLVVNAGHSGL